MMTQRRDESDWTVWQVNALVGADRDDVIAELDVPAGAKRRADGRASFWARADQLRRLKAS